MEPKMPVPPPRSLPYVIGALFMLTLALFAVRWQMHAATIRPGENRFVAPAASAAEPASATNTPAVGADRATSTLVDASSTPADVATSTVAEPVVHVPLPAEVRGLYWTAATAASPRADDLLAYMRQHHLNTAVIDLKMDDGEVAFKPNDPALVPFAQSNPGIKDLDAFLKKLGDQGVYRIARIAVMRDGMFASVRPKSALQVAGGGLWRDRKGMTWLDPAAPDVSDAAIALGHEAYARGFDEIQYDYIRYPSDGSIHRIVYPFTTSTKDEVPNMHAFFEKVGGTLRDSGIPVSFDLFGMTFWMTDDFGVGQRLADVYPYADAVSPMVYPSHYPPGFQGFANPALYPYEIVKRSLDKGIETLKATFATLDPDQARQKFRPWLQDFNLGANYDAARVEAQIKAARDAGAAGWILWNARNVYTTACYDVACTQALKK